MICITPIGIKELSCISLNELAATHKPECECYPIAGMVSSPIFCISNLSVMVANVIAFHMLLKHIAPMHVFQLFEIITGTA
jgi:hypothetical protein